MTDIIKRCAISDPLTEDEEAACLKAMESDLYVLVTAVFRKGVREGLKVNLNLSRTPRIVGGRRSARNGG